MISDTIFPSFYIVEVEGEAVKSLISEDFGIERISLGSIDFATDLVATEAMKKALEFFMTGINLGDDTVTEQIDFNPEFYPSVGKLTLTDEQKIQQEEAQQAADDMQEKLAAAGKMAVLITRAFDPLGDFVESRWTVEAPVFKIQAKIVANLNQYMQQKNLEEIKQKLSFPQCIRHHQIVH